MIKDYINDVIHNCIIHPLMVLLPAHLATDLHDWHANLIWGEHRIDELEAERQMPVAKFWYEKWTFISNAEPLEGETILALVETAETEWSDSVYELARFEVHKNDDRENEYFELDGDVAELFPSDAKIIVWKYS